VETLPLVTLVRGPSETGFECAAGCGSFAAIMDKPALKAIVLLMASNVFMTAAWYGHLKFKSAPMLLAIFASWGIALAEYMFQVPANRIGSASLSTYQLKIIQEAITLLVFTVFAYLYMGEPLRWNNAASLACLMGAVGFAFWHA
jgi:uncharacterized protein (DUF486 family)